jgi:hypothetical protein
MPSFMEKLAYNSTNRYIMKKHVLREPQIL